MAFETIPVNDDTQIVVYYDDYYEIDADEREMSPEEVEAEQALIDNSGVFIVAVQKRQKYVRVIDGHADWDDIKEEWQETDAIGGCFLDSDYTATVVAKEFGFID